MSQAKIKIKNYKSIKDLELPIETDFKNSNNSKAKILVGINESGKSAILEAINLLKSGLKNIDYNKNSFLETEEEICIEGEFPLKSLEGHENKIKKIGLDEDFIKQLKVESAVKQVFADGLTNGSRYYIRLKEDLPPSNYVISKIQKRTPNGQVKNYEQIKRVEPSNIKSNHRELKKADLEKKIGHILNPEIERGFPQIQIWKPEPKFLINNSISIEKFKNDNNTSIPLKNMFAIYGKTSKQEIKETINKAQSSQANMDMLKDQMADSVTKHLNEIWKEHNVNLIISINGDNLNVHVEDNDKKYSYFSMDQRSDGFKQFVSLILSLSAQNKADILKNNIILIDEPETHLHPSGIRYMRDEMLNIGKNNNLLISTHSHYMIDLNKPERHFIVKKEEAETELKKIEDEESFFDDAVLSDAFGISLYKELLPEQILVVEGEEDKKIINHLLSLKDINKPFSVKNAGGAPKAPAFAALLNEENIDAFFLFDNDNKGRENNEKIKNKFKSFKNKSMTISELLTNKHDYDITIEDMFPKSFVQEFFIKELNLGEDFSLKEGKSFLNQLLSANKKLKENKSQLDKLKKSLANKFIESYNTHESISKYCPLLDEMSKNLISKFEYK